MPINRCFRLVLVLVCMLLAAPGFTQGRLNVFS
jgi:hypothetical protein